MAETNILMGMAQVLKPFWYFEYWYDRTTAPAFSGSIPIPLMPANPHIPVFANPPTVDPYAYDAAVRSNTAGYSPSLAAMLPVPAVGTDSLVWIPNIPSVARDANYAYLYVPQWRLRTVGDWKRFKKQGNIYREAFGAEDTTPLTGGDRYILPAGVGHAIVSGQQLEDGAANTIPGAFQVDTALREGIAMPATNAILTQPPSGPANDQLEYQQGILDPFGSVLRNFTSGMYRPMWLKNIGNELGFLVYKIAIPQPDDVSLTFVDWDFAYNPATGFCDSAADDCYFSSIFGVGADDDGYRGRFTNSGLFVLSGKTS